MRILYVSLSYLPSDRASSVQVMRMCSALAGLGHDVELIAKRREGRVGDVHAYYGVAADFTVSALPRPRWRGGGVVYLAAVARALVAARRGATDLVYARDLAGAAIATELGLPVVLEAHVVPPPGWQRIAWRRIVRAPGFRALVPISHALAAALADAGLAPLTAPVVVAPSAADAMTGAPPRSTLAAPPRIGYVGSLYPGRGIELIEELARAMPRCRFELVGGNSADLARWRPRETGNFILRGFVAPAQLPTVYREFDVLLMPYPRSGIRGATGGVETTAWCSPVKMFEYMAAGVAMVASDLPVLQEVLADGRNALIAAAGEPAPWIAAIERLLRDAALRTRLAATAQRELEERYTARARASRILAMLSEDASRRRAS